MNVKDRVVTITWLGAPDATQYDLSITSESGQSISKVTTPTAAVSWTQKDIPPNTALRFAVAGRNAVGVGPSTSAPSFYLIDFRKVVEALFFSSGPYGENLNAFSQMHGWAQGAQIHVRLGSGLESVRGAAERTAAQLSGATGGALSATVDGGIDDATQALPNTVRVRIDVTKAVCPLGDCAITLENSTPVRTSVTILIGPNSIINPTMAHELGHALFGFAHFGGYQDSPLGEFASLLGRPTEYPFMLMHGHLGDYTRPGGLGEKLDSLTPLEIQAVTAVYAAGLRPGAPRSQFVAAGLVNP